MILDLCFGHINQFLDRLVNILGVIIVNDGHSVCEIIVQV